MANIIRAEIELNDEYYNEFLKMENGKYKSTTSYIRGVIHDHLTILMEKEIEKEKYKKDTDANDILEDVF